MRSLLPSFLVIIAVLSGGMVHDAHSFGDVNDRNFANALWEAMKKSRLVGNEAVHTQFYEGVEPHGFVLELLEKSLKVGKRTSIVVVKRNYGPAGVGLEAVQKYPNRHLKAITVMFKREKGYDDENANWFWVKYDPQGNILKNRKGIYLAGRVAKGEKQGCIFCHAAAEGRDYIFNHDRYAP